MDLTSYGVALLVVFFLIFLCIGYAGAFSTITIGVRQPDFDEGVLVYKYYQQNYRHSGEAFREQCKFPIKKKLTSIGIFYDNPTEDEIDPNKTRYVIGLYFTSTEASTHEELIKNMQEVGYSTIHLPKIKHAVVTSFPYRLMLSIPIAVFRVYPRLNKFIKEEKLDARFIMEVYPDNNKIDFVAPLQNHEDFLVKELLGTTAKYM